MDFLELQSFVVICDCRNITEAARRLYVTQPALSRRIQDMERELGITLFVRKSKGIEVTEAGLSLYEDAVQLLAQRQAFSEKVERLQRGTAGTLRIASAPYLCRLAMMRCVAAMARDYPMVTQSFVSDLSTGIGEMIQRGNLDVALCFRSDLVSWRDISWQRVAECRVSFLVGQGHRFWDREKIFPRDLAGETIWVFCPPAHHLSATAITTRLRQQCPDIRNIFYTTSMKDAIFYAMTGQAISLYGIVPGDWMPVDRDVARNIPLESPHSGQGLLVAASNPDKPMAQVCINYLKRELSGEAPTDQKETVETEELAGS